MRQSRLTYFKTLRTKVDFRFLFNDFVKKNKIRIFALQMNDATTYSLGTAAKFSPTPLRPRRP
jgi:hypothetical protein